MITLMPIQLAPFIFSSTVETPIRRTSFHDTLELPSCMPRPIRYFQVHHVLYAHSCSLDHLSKIGFAQASYQMMHTIVSVRNAMRHIPLLLCTRRANNARNIYRTVFNEQFIQDMSNVPMTITFT